MLITVTRQLEDGYRFNLIFSVKYKINKKNYRKFKPWLDVPVTSNNIATHLSSSSETLPNIDSNENVRLYRLLFHIYKI